MSSGSWASDSPDSIGDKPVHMGAWEKLALGWLGDNLARVALGADVTVNLGPAEGAPRGRHRRCASICPTSPAPHPVSRRRRGSELLLLGQGRQHRHVDDASFARRACHAHLVPGQLGHRDRLGLRLPRSAGRRRVAARGDERVAHHQSQRPELRLRNQRRFRRLDDGDGDAAGRHHRHSLPLLDGWRRRTAGHRHRHNHGRRQHRQRHETRPRWTFGGFQPADQRPVHGDVLPLLPRRIAQLLAATIRACAAPTTSSRQLAREAVLRAMGC